MPTNQNHLLNYIYYRHDAHLLKYEYNVEMYNAKSENFLPLYPSSSSTGVITDLTWVMGIHVCT